MSGWAAGATLWARRRRRQKQVGAGLGYTCWLGVGVVQAGSRGDAERRGDREACLSVSSAGTLPQQLTRVPLKPAATIATSPALLFSAPALPCLLQTLQ